MRNRILENISYSLWKLNASARIDRALRRARNNLKKLSHKPRYLIDNSVIGNATTHKSSWISTGTSLWGGAVPVETGYECRLPLYDKDSEDKLYKETEFLVGLTALAREGLIEFVTSAELFQERLRQPRGRYIGHKTDDLNLLRGIRTKSVDGYFFEPKDCEESQNSRISECTAEEFRSIKKLLSNGGTGKKTTFDAWHLYTVQRYQLSGFLTMDFRLAKASLQGAKEGGLFVRSPAVLPSDVAKEIGLSPIKPVWLTYNDVRWFARHDISYSRITRGKADGGKMRQPTQGDKRHSMKKSLPPADDVKGILVDTKMACVNIQYADSDGDLHEVSMSLPNAMYLLSLLKGVQLNLDIPFPDDPRDPNSPVVRPSER